MKEDAYSWKLKLFLLIIFITPFIILFGIVLFDAIVYPKSSGEIFLDIRVKTDCQGVVNSIYRQKMNNNQLTLVTEDCAFIVDSKWTSKFLIGDSISKKGGELFVEHYRDGKLIEILDYRDIAKDMK